MLPRLNDYKRVVGIEKIKEICEAAEPLQDKHITHINSVSSGGGVAEILNSLVILMNELGIETGWRLLKGTHSFFDITKKFHNALQGEKINLTKRKKKIYLQEIHRNCLMNHLQYHDLVVVHDPQALAMIECYKKIQPWVWRCHIDIKHSDKNAWNFLKQFVEKYDAMVVSVAKYKKKINVPQFVIPPSIDPLSVKNKKIPEKECKKILSKNNIDLDKPLLCQVSRFDKWKNPFGVLKIFEKVKKKCNARLVLIGDMAGDDPEGPKMFERLRQKVEKIKTNSDIILITKKDDALVNALQTKSDVIIQNSKREGFGMVVSEALWKRTPVVGTRVGGIPLQIRHGKTGFLMRNEKEGAHYCLRLLENENLRKKLGENGREHIRKNFLITRQLKDYLDLFNHLLGNKK